jgi:hypothetical protein
MPVYIIKIKNETDSSEGSKAFASTLKEGGGAVGKNAAAVMSGKTINGIAKLAGAKTALNIADSIANLYINRVELTTGNSTYQQRLADTKGYVTKATNAALAIGGAAMVGGPGAALMTAGGIVISDLIKHTIAEQELQIRMSIEAETIRMANVRAGSYGGRTAKN